MDRNRDDMNEPLASEQMEREDWREGETILGEEEAEGHTLPESERDRATSDRKQEVRGPGFTMLPPD